jgi:glycosyltransferase involved in cell wall biosynthesis
MKSICFIVQSVYDGDPRVRRKAEALLAAGYTVDVLALRSTDGKKDYSLNGVSVRTLALGRKRGSLARYLFEYTTFFLWACFRAPLQMRRRGYEVIDVNTLPDFLIFAPFIARWMGAKLILDMHEITPEFYISKYGIGEDSWIVRVLKALEKISIDFADHVITVNEPIEDLLISRGLRRSKSTVMMNAVDETPFLESRSTAVPYLYDPKRFVMMYHGTLNRIYGLDIAIEAFARVKEEMPEAEFWIAGSGSEETMLATLIQEHGLSPQVKLLGQVRRSEIPKLLSQCDVGVLPTRRDIFLDFAFPNKLPEYIIMGKAAIVSRLRAIRYYFSENALQYFEPDNPDELSRQMVRMYRDPQLRTRLATRAKEEYTPINWALMKQRYLRLIDELVGVAPPPTTETPSANATVIA